MKKNTKIDSRPATKADLAKTFDKFAGMMKRSFDDVHDRLDTMVTRAEFEPFKKETERSFFSLQTDVTELKTKVGNVESRLTRVEEAVDAWRPLWRDHESRIVKIEEKTLA